MPRIGGLLICLMVLLSLIKSVEPQFGRFPRLPPRPASGGKFSTKIKVGVGFGASGGQHSAGHRAGNRQTGVTLAAAVGGFLVTLISTS